MLLNCTGISEATGIEDVPVKGPALACCMFSELW